MGEIETGASVHVPPCIQMSSEISGGGCESTGEMQIQTMKILRFCRWDKYQQRSGERKPPCPASE
jgi:hypothetical protein